MIFLPALTLLVGAGVRCGFFKKSRTLCKFDLK